jgi:hypothetical protein
MIRVTSWRSVALGIGFAASLCGVAAPASADNGKVLFISDFESGILNDADTTTPSQGWKRMGNMPSVSKDYVRAGTYSMKVYLNKNMPTTYRTMGNTAWTTTSDAKNRTTSTHTPFFQDSWIGFSIYLPTKGQGATWKTASRTYEVLAQWHDSHDPFPPPPWDSEESKNPVFSLGITSQDGAEPGREWRVSWLGESRTPYPTKGSPRPWKYESNRGFKLGSIDPDLDKWTDFVVHIRWNFWPVGSSGNSSPAGYTVTDNKPGSSTGGLVQVWKNGKLVVDEQSAQVGSHDNAGPVFSFGIYKGWREQKDRDLDPIVNDRLLYYDEFRYAGQDGSYAAVAPGGASTDQDPPPRAIPRPPTSVALEAGK